MLSICTTVKNWTTINLKDRVLEPLPSFLKSINKITEDAELIISDWGSNIPIKDTIDKYITNIPYKIIDMGNNKFSRSTGLNTALGNASGENILLVDADISIKNKSIKNGLKKVDENNIYLPIVFAFTEFDNKKGLWCKNDYGTVMAKKEWLEKIGPLQDNDKKSKKFLMGCRNIFALAQILREKDRGFTHHWHPNTNKNIWTRRK